nr:hypothetical protein [uncultured Psychroserpens sp.]
MKLDPELKFSASIDNITESEISNLLLTHCFAGASFYQIISDQFIKAKICPHYGHELAYFFYGKPSYLVDSAPTYLVLEKKNNISHPFRVSPLDTGGVKGGYYDYKGGYKVSLESLEGFGIECNNIEESIKVSKKIIKKYFKNQNENYFDDNLDSDYSFTGEKMKDLKLFPKLVCSICNVQNGMDPRAKDPRRNSIEIQSTQDVNLYDFEIIAIYCFNEVLSDNLESLLALLDEDYKRKITLLDQRLLFDPYKTRDKIFDDMRDLQFS